ncbi:methyl-accepting chemotaxis protein [Bacillus piscicola]|uniref:methyl-accepting chemotaxis protein n=1 Tax=Bacillus piscicola TaxID=1632684 RepID=UPI003B833E9B
MTEEIFSSYERAGLSASDTVKLRNEIVPLQRQASDGLKELIAEERASVDKNISRLQKQGDYLAVTSILAGIFLIILGGILAWVLAQRMTKPLKLVTDQVARVSEGDLSVEAINIKSRDEIGQLAVHINVMVDNLRRLLGSVHQAADQVASTSEELSASSEETAASTNEITGTIQEVSGAADTTMSHSNVSLQAMQELTAGVEKIVDSSAEVTRKAKETEETAKKGNEEIVRSSEQIRVINHEVQDSAEIIKHLGKRSTEIGSIIETITNISEQTNLLALNAAIEAARAGEHGRGFAVVADEVRKLAEESSRSAQQIKELIEAIQDETNKAVKKMVHGQAEAKEGVAVIERAGTAFQTILTSIYDVTTQIENVSAVSKQMAANSEHVTSAIAEMNHVAETTAGSAQNVAAGTEQQLAAIEEVSSSSEELSRMAQELQEEVSVFKL